MERSSSLRLLTDSPSFRAALGIPRDAPLDLRPLAQGEYHKNYVFRHPISSERMVLRVNYGSQMHLAHQIEYEYQALQALARSGRTPVPLYVDGSRTVFPQGILVMKYLPGRPLDYGRDMEEAARALADVHSTPVADPSFLVTEPSPIRGILKECREMFSRYQCSPYKDAGTEARIIRMLGEADRRAADLTDGTWQSVLINTELNNRNFIVDGQGKVSVIDWEKPLWGDPAQDLGHMLAPTTSFWKTDRILGFREADQFADQYIEAVNGRVRLGRFRERLRIFLQVTCMRGITWCAMAWDEYMRPGRALRNEETFEKLKAYLSDDFLDIIEDYMLRDE